MFEGVLRHSFLFFFFFNDTATTEIYTLSLHDALPISLYPRAPDLRLRATQDLSDGELFYIIENGVRFTGMPAWGDGGEGSRRPTGQLGTFIRHFPPLSAGEKLRMEALNPKGPPNGAELR